VTELILAYFDARWRISPETRILFLDLGSNTGQAFSIFSKIFSQGKVTFELFEPNPHCFEILTLLAQDFPGSAKCHQKAVGTLNGFGLLYGLAEDEGGRFSVGASLLEEHNPSSREHAVRVEVFDFAQFLEERRGEYDLVVVKMDIEGSELEVLDHLIRTKSIEIIDVLYVEFHSSFVSEDKLEIVMAREHEIVSTLRGLGSLKFRKWH
jgi:FkbM family methyltransferase